MITLQKLRFELLEPLNMYSDDSTITYRLLDQYIEEYREAWFKKLYNKFNRTVPTVYYQTLSCLELETVDIAECCTTLTGCEILRTKKEIPTVLSISDGDLIAKVSPVGIKAIPFYLMKYEQLEWFGNGRNEQNIIGTFYYNNRLYFYCKNKFNYSLLEKVTMRAVFRYPSDVMAFKDCTGQPCFTPETEYPIEAELWNIAKKDILYNEFKIKLETEEDNTLDNAKTGNPIRPNAATE